MINSTIEISTPGWKQKIVELPTSKSLTHRVYILAGLNTGVTRISDYLESEDTSLTLTAMEKMGMTVEKAGEMQVCRGPIGRVGNDDIFLGNSGSSARFLLPIPAYVDKPVYLHGDRRLHERPVSELFSAMLQLGIRYAAENDRLPVRVFPGKVRGGTIRLPDLPSSQVVTSLMMAGLWMENDLDIVFEGMVPSAPYFEMTIKLMKRLGISVDRDDNHIFVKAKKPAFDWNVTVEKDLSAAAYWVVLALINEVEITLPDMTLPSLQGDEKIFEIAEDCGGRVSLEREKVIIQGKIRRGLTIDCRDIPDLVPPLSILGMFAPEPVLLLNVEHLKFKESDRVAAIQENIKTVGGESEYLDGNLLIRPRSNYRPGLIRCFNDHRIAMSFAIAGTRIPGLTLDTPSCVQKSYPAFWNHFDAWKKL